MVQDIILEFWVTRITILESIFNKILKIGPKSKINSFDDSESLSESEKSNKNSLYSLKKAKGFS